MDTREKTIEFLRFSGPIIPVKLAKHLNTNILMASAFLSELTATGKAKVSHLKVGGTPLYYTPGHESKLQNFAGNLGTKEKKAYDELASKKVLADKNLDSLTRVSLKDLKDFAISITMDNEIYWKWYLTSDADAINLIKENYQQKKILSTPPIAATASQPMQNHTGQLSMPQQTTQPAIINIQSQQTAIVETLPVETSPLQTTLLEKPLPKKTSLPKPKKTPATDDFLLKVQDHFRQNKIEVAEIKPKKSDIECTIKVPSDIGNILCYCRAKFKKSITDADISSAFLQSQYKGMPLLFLYIGELNKKAQEMLKAYPTIIIKKLPS